MMPNWLPNTTIPLKIATMIWTALTDIDPHWTRTLTLRQLLTNQRSMTSSTPAHRTPLDPQVVGWTKIGSCLLDPVPPPHLPAPSRAQLCINRSIRVIPLGMATITTVAREPPRGTVPTNGPTHSSLLQFWWNPPKVVVSYTKLFVKVKNYNFDSKPFFRNSHFFPTLCTTLTLFKISCTFAWWGGFSIIPLS